MKILMHFKVWMAPWSKKIFWIVAPVDAAAVVNRKSTKTLFANGASTLFINGKATPVNGAVILNNE